MLVEIVWKVFLVALAITWTAKLVGASIDGFLLFAWAFAGSLALLILWMVLADGLRSPKGKKDREDAE